MRKTYDEILNSMNQAFYEECGENPENLHEIETRLKSVATELYALSVYGDYILKQAFASTAVGAYLDMHGKMAGITRKSGSVARGRLTFFLEEAADQKVTVPAGTICAVEEQPFIQFFTVQSGAIAAGALSVTLNAVAMEQSSSFNVPAGAVTVIVNPPAAVCSVTNQEAFTGGSGEEGDDAFRSRILESRRVPANGVNANSLASIILQNEEVLDCLITGCDQTNAVNVYVKTRSRSVTDDLRASVTDTLGICQMTGCTLHIFEAAEKAVKIICDVQLYAGYDAAQAAAQFRAAAKAYCAAEKIGSGLSLSALSGALTGIEGVISYTVHSPDEVNAEIPCQCSEYICVSDLEVNCFV